MDAAVRSGLISWLSCPNAGALVCAPFAIAAARSAFGFGVARFALGLGEAENFPACIKTVAEWFPRQERALATGIFNAGSNIGAVVAPLIVPYIALRHGWRWAQKGVKAGSIRNTADEDLHQRRSRSSRRGSS